MKKNLYILVMVLTGLVSGVYSGEFSRQQLAVEWAGVRKFPDKMTTPQFLSRKLTQTAVAPEANPQEATPDQVSPSGTKYVLYSLILPGAGEWAMGHKGLGKFFVGTELVLWIAYFGTHQYIDNLNEDFQTFAALHAQVNTSGKDDRYWAAVGNNDNIYEYNQEQLQNRNLDGLFPETDFYYWQWDETENRYRYNRIRVDAHDWERRATFLLSGFILNRLISAIDVIRIIRQGKKNAQERHSRLHFDLRSTPRWGNLFRVHLSLRW